MESEAEDEAERRSLDSDQEGMLRLESSNAKSMSNFSGTQWTSLPQPLVIDSGAAVAVMPKTWCTDHQTRESVASKAGDFYTTADGGIV